MFVRLTTVPMKPGTVDEATAIVRDSIIPAAKEQPGFAGANLLASPDGTKAIMVTLWATEADMNAGEASDYYKAQVGKAAHTFAGPPTLEHFEVKVSTYE